MVGQINLTYPVCLSRQTVYQTVSQMPVRLFRTERNRETGLRYHISVNTGDGLYYIGLGAQSVFWQQR